MRFFKKYWWIIIIICVAIGLPIVLVPCCKNDSKVLSYYGGVIGGILAIIGVFLTVRYSQNQYQDGQRNSVIPFIAVNVLHRRYKGPEVKYGHNSSNDGLEIKLKNPSPIDPIGYKEYKATDYVFIIKNGEVELRNKLNKNQQERAEKMGLINKEITQGVYACLAVNDVYLPIDLENVGNGSAINFRLGLNASKVSPDKRLYSGSISVNMGEHVSVHIYSEDCDRNSSNLGEYILGMTYQDIFGNRYSQEASIILDYDDSINKVVVRTNMYQTQQRLKIRDAYSI